jgi:HK97 family phage prohead protease
MTREPGTFLGLASAYDTLILSPVNGPLIIAPGAFANATKDWSRVRLLREHDRDRILGSIVRLWEDEKGLWVEGRFANTPEGQEVAELARSGAMPEMSVAFDILKFSMGTHEGKRVKVVEAADLYDVSLCAWGLNPGARLKEAASRTTDWRRELELIEADYARLTGSPAPEPAPVVPQMVHGAMAEPAHQHFRSWIRGEVR